MSGPVDEWPPYLGDQWAIAIFELWRRRSHVVRRVETHSVIDRSITAVQITLDLHLPRIREAYKPLLPSSPGQQLVDPHGNPYSSQAQDISPIVSSGWALVPLMLRRRGQFLRVDCVDSQERTLHLARASRNNQIAAHVIVGCVLKDKSNHPTSVPGSPLYQAAYGFVSHTDPGLEGLVASGESGEYNLSDFELQLALWNVHVSTSLIALLDDLGEQYIQCAYLQVADGDVEIVKLMLEAPTPQPVIRWTQSRPITKDYLRWDDTGEDGEEESYHLDVEGHSEEPTPPSSFYARIDTSFRRTVRQSQEAIWIGGRSLGQLLGITPFEIKLDRLNTLHRSHPTHMRFIAPPGTMIDGVEHEIVVKPGLEDQEVGRIAISHHAVSLHDLGHADAQYSLLFKINPKRGLFLVPATAALALVLLILSLSLLAGPKVLTTGASGTVGALSVLPTLAVVFVARADEHEILGKLSGALRTLVITAFGAATLAGVSIGLLGGSKYTGLVEWEFRFLTLAWVTALAVTFALLWQIARIQSDRSQAKGRRRKDSFEWERISVRSSVNPPSPSGPAWQVILLWAGFVVGFLIVATFVYYAWPLVTDRWR